MTNNRRFRRALLAMIMGGWTLSLLISSQGTAAPITEKPAPKPRVVVTADPELDDSNSLVR